VSVGVESVASTGSYDAAVRDRPLLLGSLIVVAAASGFGILGPLARFGYDAGLDPVSFVGWRAIFAVVVIAAVIAVRSRRGHPFHNPWRLPVRDRAAILVVGLSGLALNIAMFFAFGVTSIAVALLAFYTYPAIVAAVAAVLGHERLDTTRLAALGLALLGMVLVVGGGLLSEADVTVQPLGVVLGLAAAGGQTVFVTVSRSSFRSLPPEQAMGWIVLVTAIGCSVLSLLTGGRFGVVFERADAFALAVIAGTIGAGIPSVLFLVGIRAIGGTRAGILMLFEPLVGVTLAALLLREAVTPVQALGGAAILAAALLVQRSAGPVDARSPVGVASVEHG
jgi:drug/metabolite transporter (DMT)-like permease